MAIEKMAVLGIISFIIFAVCRLLSFTVSIRVCGTDPGFYRRTESDDTRFQYKTIYYSYGPILLKIAYVFRGIGISFLSFIVVYATIWFLTFSFVDINHIVVLVVYTCIIVHFSVDNVEFFHCERHLEPSNLQGYIMNELDITEVFTQRRKGTKSEWEAIGVIEKCNDVHRLLDMIRLAAKCRDEKDFLMRVSR